MNLFAYRHSIVLLLASVVYQAALADSQSDCINRAAFWHEGKLNRLFSEVEADSALAACELAVRKAPDNPIANGLYCRTLIKNNLPLLAMEYCSVASGYNDPLGVHLKGFLVNDSNSSNACHPKSIHWFRKAAELGYVASMIALSQCLLQENASKDAIKESEYWLTIALLKGAPQAAYYLALAKYRSESVSGKSMHVKDIQAIREPVRLWTSFESALKTGLQYYGTRGEIVAWLVKHYVGLVVEEGQRELAMERLDYWIRQIKQNSSEVSESTLFLLVLKAEMLVESNELKHALQIYNEIFHSATDDYVTRFDQTWFRLTKQKVKIERELKLVEESDQSLIFSYRKLSSVGKLDLYKRSSLCSLILDRESIKNTFDAVCYR